MESHKVFFVAEVFWMVSDNDMGAHDLTTEVGNTQKADSRYMEWWSQCPKNPRSLKTVEHQDMQKVSKSVETTYATSFFCRYPSHSKSNNPH